MYKMATRSLNVHGIESATRKRPKIKGGGGSNEAGHLKESELLKEQEMDAENRARMVKLTKLQARLETELEQLNTKEQAVKKRYKELMVKYDDYDSEEEEDGGAARASSTTEKNDVHASQMTLFSEINDVEDRLENVNAEIEELN